MGPKASLKGPAQVVPWLQSRIGAGCTTVKACQAYVGCHLLPSEKNSQSSTPYDQTSDCVDTTLHRNLTFHKAFRGECLTRAIQKAEYALLCHILFHLPIVEGLQGEPLDRHRGVRLFCVCSPSLQNLGQAKVTDLDNVPLAEKHITSSQVTV